MISTPAVLGITRDDAPGVAPQAVSLTDIWVNRSVRAEDRRRRAMSAPTLVRTHGGSRRWVGQCRGRSHNPSLPTRSGEIFDCAGRVQGKSWPDTLGSVRCL